MNLKWHNEKRKIKDLKLFEDNPRKMTDKQAEDLMNSLKKFNIAEIPAIDTKNRILAGNMRITALKKLGRENEEIDVRVPNRELTEAEAKEYCLRSNKNTGSWDYDLLANFSETELKDVGFESDELDQIFGLEQSDEFDEQKELEKVLAGKERRVKDGDLWQLGNHKLLIGDCVKKENWERLLGNERFDFMFTDPPYKLDYLKRVENFKREKGFGYKASRGYKGLKERGLPKYDEWLLLANEFQNPKGTNVMVFENWKNIREIWNAIEKYWKIRNIIIWYLPNRHLGWGGPWVHFNKFDIAPLAGEGIMNQEYEEELEKYLKDKGQKLLDTYEVILYGQKGKSEWSRKKGSKWMVSDHITWATITEKLGGRNIIFGTKPIQILVPYIKILSPRDGIVMEPFGGSGSTIIASEIMKRKCRAIEIAPIYGEVILNRFEKFTGIKATKL